MHAMSSGPLGPQAEQAATVIARVLRAQNPQPAGD